MAKLLSPERLSSALKEVLSEFSELSQAKANKGTRMAAIKTFAGIVKMTPIGNSDRWETSYKPEGYVGGRARNNWFLGTTVTDKKTDDTDEKGTGYITKDMPKDVLSSPVYFYNNLPYIRSLEFGHSKQAPKGMVRINVLKWKKNLRKAFKDIK